MDHTVGATEQEIDFTVIIRHSAGIALNSLLQQCH